MVKDREAWRAAAQGVTKSRTRLTEQQQQQKSSKLIEKGEGCLMVIVSVF